MTNEMTAFEALLTRRSVRKFTDEPVSESDLTKIIRAGMFAPSAHNYRTWDFISITDRATIDKLESTCKQYRALKTATLCIVTCASSNVDSEWAEIFCVQNGSAATENMLLAIHALGLGAVWLNAAKGREQYDEVKALLNIPDDVIVVSVLAVGHPDSDLSPRADPQDRFEIEKWHREQW